MTTEQTAPVTTRDVAVYVEDVLQKDADETAIALHLAKLSRDDFLRIWQRTKPLSKVLSAIGRLAKKRAQAELVIGATWTDPDTQQQYVWEKGKSDDWKVKDPMGLRLGLAKLVRKDGSRLVSDPEIDTAVPLVPDPQHTVLTRLAERDVQIKEFIEDCREKPETAADLRERGK